MDLLDRYLQAVKKLLPWKRQDDIIAELRANLEAQLEEKEAALGRPLSQGEAEDWLRQLGAPSQMAAQYLPQRYLIGPGLFPTYLHVLKLVAGCSMLVYGIVSTVEILASSQALGDHIAVIVGRVPGILLTGAAWVTAVFAGLEFAGVHYSPKMLGFAAEPLGFPGAKWEPGSLPPVEEELPAGMRRRTYANVVAEVVFGWIALVWLLLIPQHPYLLFGPGAAFLHGSPFELAPVWSTVYMWTVALTALNVVWRGWQLGRGTWQRQRPVFEIAWRVVGLIPLWLLLAVQDRLYITLGPGVDVAKYGDVLNIVNRSVYWGSVGIIVITLLQLVGTLGKMAVEASRKRVAVML